MARLLVLLPLSLSLLPGCQTLRHQPPRDATHPRAATIVRDDNPEGLMEGRPPAAIKSALTHEQGLRIARAPQPLTPIARPPDAPESVFMAHALREAAPGQTDPFRVHALNIGAGTCALLECPNSDDVVVYDCGQMAPSDTDLTADQIRDYYNAVAGDDNPTVVLSHPDRDHVNRISPMLGDHTAESVWFGGELGDYRDTIAEWLEAQDANGVPIYFGWEPGYSGNGAPIPELQCGDATAYLLTVNTERGTNPASLMLLYEYGDFSVVLSGDAEGPGEEMALANHRARLAGTTVVFASHHGARTHDSNHAAWVSALDPLVVIYSSGTSHGHPTGDVVERYAPLLVEAETHDMWDDPFKSGEDRYETIRSEYVTELNGTIVVETDGEFFSVACSFDETC